MTTFPTYPTLIHHSHHSPHAVAFQVVPFRMSARSCQAKCATRRSSVCRVRTPLQHRPAVSRLALGASSQPPRGVMQCGGVGLLGRLGGAAGAVAEHSAGRGLCSNGLSAVEAVCLLGSVPLTPRQSPTRGVSTFTRGGGGGQQPHAHTSTPSPSRGEVSGLPSTRPRGLPPAAVGQLHLLTYSGGVRGCSGSQPSPPTCTSKRSGGKRTSWAAGLTMEAKKKQDLEAGKRKVRAALHLRE
jgi:hypothetical protein